VAEIKVTAAVVQAAPEQEKNWIPAPGIASTGGKDPLPVVVVAA